MGPAFNRAKWVPWDEHEFVPSFKLQSVHQGDGKLPLVIPSMKGKNSGRRVTAGNQSTLLTLSLVGFVVKLLGFGNYG
ncbi:uncharacterized protein RAG0_07760 [Rhynchosporium agropyri]|uniref:Uncharacterized protein n=1 Tax=Rhynchosporium agropyri TaxID=914238 RepID=A0A1E1KN44_9HELO|nr:uncharacterized protein RAG0_07760 [Rhynchosporium agropyri]